MTIQIGSDNLCDCNCGTICPLGKMGMEYRCTKEELESNGIKFKMKQNKKIIGRTHKNLKSILNQCLINPNEAQGTIKIILESGNANYFEARAIEYINEARSLGFLKQSIQASDSSEVSEHQMQQYEEKINNAITLLSLARLYRKYK